MWYSYNDRLDVSDLEGKEFIDVSTAEGDRELIFTEKGGKKYKMFHIQDCCENVYLDDVIGSLDDLIGSPIRKAEEVTNRSGGGKTTWDTSYTWTFYHFTTEEGYDVTLRWYGTSNGYYAEDVTLVELQ